MKKTMLLFIGLTVAAAFVFANGSGQTARPAATGKTVEWATGTTTNVTPKPLAVSPQAGTDIEFPQPATSYTTNTKYPNQPAVSNLNGFPIVQQTVNMSVATPTITTISDYVNNDATIYMEKLTNVHVNFIMLPTENFLERVNLMVASGEKLPDVFACVMFGASDQITLGQSGSFLPLNDLIERHGYNFQRLMKDHEEVRPSITTADGNIYSLPHYEINEADRVAHRFWINQLFLNNLGMKMPTTTEEFYQYLVAVRDKDPNKNGIKDEVPLMSSRNAWNSGIESFLMNSFIFDDQAGYGTGARRMFIDSQGKIQVNYNKPEFRQGLEYFYRLGSEGLLDPLSFTQTSNELVAFVEQANVPNRLGAVSAGAPNGFTELNGERRKDFSPVTPLKGPNGRQAVYYDRFRPVMGGRFSITKDCQIPDVAMKWADACYTTDWWTRNRFGVLGRDWIIPPAGTVAVDGGPAKYQEVLKWGETTSAYWATNNFSVAGWASYNQAKSLTDPFEFEAVLWQARNQLWPYRDMNIMPGALPYTLAEAREVNQLNPLLCERVNTLFAQAATGKLQITDAVWNSYVAELDKMGLPRLLEIVQGAFDRGWAQSLGYKK
ncbi:MAG: extracellular solute-binding protein [Treponema sp.]|nr:extracellular solute-binding protein [Treponema sp.]